MVDKSKDMYNLFSSDKIKLGDEVEEKITKYRGIVTGIAYYATGCVQALIVPRATSKPNEECWIDVKRLALLKDKVFSVSDDQMEKADAGPQNNPPNRYP